MIDKNNVESKFIQFRSQNNFTKALDEYTTYLAKLGYTDRAILLHISPMMYDLIIKNGGKNE